LLMLVKLQILNKQNKGNKKALARMMSIERICLYFFLQLPWLIDSHA
jgi:hypothetical protein